jgi:cold shock CspA family protein
MYFGTIRHYNADKGYGFVRGDDFSDHFFHINQSSYFSTSEIPAVGTRVSYTTGVDSRSGRPIAVAVAKVKSNAAPQIRGNDPR